MVISRLQCYCCVLSKQLIYYLTSLPPTSCSKCIKLLIQLCLSCSFFEAGKVLLTVIKDKSEFLSDLIQREYTSHSLQSPMLVLLIGAVGLPLGYSGIQDPSNDMSSPFSRSLRWPYSVEHGKEKE